MDFKLHMTNHIDLTNCDREPIHIPGRIQSHGFMVAIDSITFKASYVSDNLVTYIGITSQELLNMSADELNAQMSVYTNKTDVRQLLELGISQKNFDIINPYRLHINDHPYYLIIHQSDTNFVLEFEPATMEYDIQGLLGRSISEVLLNRSLAGFLQNAAREVRRIIEFDRVMIYQFLEDGHGVVMAEEREETLEPFLGLHYPASDIPKQARELYKANYTRIIADVNAESSAITTFNNGTPLDLTHSSLRAVSPIHIQYLKNMGVESSFSISLLSGGELWGLIACHNYSPKFIDYRAREGAKLIGQILSSALEFRQTEEETQSDLKLKEITEVLSGDMDRCHDLISCLLNSERNVLDITYASGAAILFEGQLHRIGITPEEPDLQDLFVWLKSSMTESIYHTDKLSEVYAPALAYAPVASGILACMLNKEMGEFMVWFKPELISTINWAGNPEKPVEIQAHGLMVLSPRHSFESWAEIVKHTSDKWKQIEISGVLKVREKVVSITYKKTNEIRLLNDQLRLAYDELDTFSYTISHDLRTPLTSIKSYTQLFLAQNKNLDEKGMKLLSRVVAGAEKMELLINEILNLAQVGRSKIDFVELEMPVLIREVTSEVIAALNAQHIEVIIDECPRVKGDKTLIIQVFTNLVSNAIKYAAKSLNPKIIIGGYIKGNDVVYAIKDNGIGIDASHHDKVFEIFKRMENVKDFEGTGVGLTIVKRIIDRHHGKIWFESELGKGTVFYVSFKLDPTDL
jgi:chemotaxis family two-component system sensor kinase Cph1